MGGLPPCRPINKKHWLQLTHVKLKKHVLCSRSRVSATAFGIVILKKLSPYSASAVATEAHSLSPKPPQGSSFSFLSKTCQCIVLPWHQRSAGKTCQCIVLPWLQGSANRTSQCIVMPWHQRSAGKACQCIRCCLGSKGLLVEHVNAL